MKTETFGDAPPSLESRLPSFWARVSPEPNSGCWLREALAIATQALEIAGDWHAPQAYDIEVPESWQDTIDPDGAEPTWPTLNGIVRKCRAALRGEP